MGERSCHATQSAPANHVATSSALKKAEAFQQVNFHKLRKLTVKISALFIAIFTYLLPVLYFGLNKTRC